MDYTLRDISNIILDTSLSSIGSIFISIVVFVIIIIIITAAFNIYVEEFEKRKLNFFQRIYFVVVTSGIIIFVISVIIFLVNLDKYI